MLLRPCSPNCAPPARETGAVKWARENLFSNVTNSVLTVVSLILIYMILQNTLPWIMNGVWNAGSLAECREILAGKSGACFAVLTERWPQLIYGFKYPPDQYWRPNLAFIMMLVAIAPVLFFDLPRKMLIFTGLYPFIAFWLIWGGTILVPLLALAGCVAAGVTFQKLGRSNFAAGFFGAIAVALVVWNVGGLLIPADASENSMLSAVPSRDLGAICST